MTGRPEGALMGVWQDLGGRNASFQLLLQLQEADGEVGAGRRR